MARRANGMSAADLVQGGLPDQWYALLPADWVRDVPVGITRMGQRLVLWRDPDDQIHVQYDRCPHRGAKLSQGHVVDGYLTCAYHGIQIDGAGDVAKVSAYPGCKVEGMHGVRTFPSAVSGGCVFAWFGEGEPEPVAFPPEFDDPSWSYFICTATWQGNYMLALENLVDPMHGTYAHAQSYTLGGGARNDEMEIEKTDEGFIVRRQGQTGINFDWTDLRYTGADWVRLDLPYPKGAGPGGMFRIIGYVTPIGRDACQVFFWRMRKIEGWERDTWRFMYKSRLEERHWHVLEQDRVLIEGMEVPDSELLYQHDIGVTELRRLLQRRARDVLKAREAPRAAAE